MNTAANAHREQPQRDQQILRERRLPGAVAHLIDTRRMPRNAQFSTAPDKQRGHHRRRLAVRIGQPGVHRRQSHLGAVAHQHEDEGGLQPGRLQVRRRGSAARPATATVADRPGPAVAAATPRKKVPQQGQRDAHGADQQVFPGRFERAVMAMKVDQGRSWPAWSPRPPPTARPDAG